MASINVESVLPKEFLIAPPVSVSKSILRKNLLELLPHEQTDFQYSANNQIRFNISSNSDFLMGGESYIRFDIKMTTDNNVNPLIDEGGAHAIFRSIELRTIGNGSLIERVDYYNRWYACQSNLRESKAHVEQSGWLWKDGTEEGEYISNTHQQVLSFEGAGGDLVGVAFAASSGHPTYTSVVTLLDDADEQIRAGDIMVVTESDGAVKGSITRQFPVLSATNATTLVIGLGQTGTAPATTDVLSVQILRAHAIDNPRLFRDATVYTIVMQLDSSVLKQNWPLFLMKGGIELVLELENPDRVFFSANHDLSAVASNSFDYVVTRPRFMAMMVTPHPSIIEEYTSQWRKPEGLMYSIPAVRVRRATGSNTDVSTHHQFHLGVRSARRAYVIMTDTQISDLIGQTARMNRSISAAIRGNVTKYQLKIGSHEYPQRNVDLRKASGTALTNGAEAYMQMRNALGLQGTETRLTPGDWLPTSSYFSGSAGSPATDSRKFYIVVPLDRHNGIEGELTGADLSVVPLDIDIGRELTSSAGYNNLNWQGEPIYYLFVEHDQFLKISSTQMSVLN